MGTALSGMLTINEGVVFLTILIGMGKGNLNILALKVDNGVKGIVRHTVFQQILQTMTGKNAPIIIHNGQANIQIGIVTKHVFHNFIVELIVQELRSIWFEIDIGTVLVLSRFCNIAHQLTTLKDSLAHLTFTIASHFETTTQGIYSFYTYAIQTNRLLKGLRVELSTGIKDTYRFYQFALGDASPVVANRDAEVVLYIHLDAIARLHLKLVNRVIEHLFQQYIDTILR